MNSSPEFPSPDHYTYPPDEYEPDGFKFSQDDSTVNTYLLPEHGHRRRKASEYSLPPIPPAWKFDDLSYGSSRLQFALKTVVDVLVMISYGHASLEQKWRLVHTDDMFMKEKDRVTQRFTVNTVVSGLLLTCLVALITTGPPVGAVINYTIRGPYICLWVAFGILLGGIIVSFTDMFIMTTCDFKFTNERIMATRPRVVFFLFFLAYPFFAIGIATVVCALGLVAAVWLSQDHLARIGCIFLFLVPLSLIVPFTLTQVLDVLREDREAEKFPQDAYCSNEQGERASTR